MGTASTWSVDADGTRALLADVDLEGADLCTAASHVGQAGELALEAVRHSHAVSGALSAFLEDRDSAPMRVAAAFSTATSALITAVDAVVFGDEEMSVTSMTAARTADSPRAFSAERFGGPRAW